MPRTPGTPDTPDRRRPLGMLDVPDAARSHGAAG